MAKHRPIQNAGAEKIVLIDFMKSPFETPSYHELLSSGKEN